VLLFPLITRELQVQSRKRATYNGRVTWGLLILFLLAFFALNFPVQSANGRYLLALIHAPITLILFLQTPLGAADAISREKREGTLGLLLLTGLTPREVVLGKLVANFIQLFYFVLTMLPFIIIPVLLGGVGPQDFLLSVVIWISIVAAGLSAGLVASAIFTGFGAAICCAMVLAAALIVLISSFVVNTLFTFPNRFPEDLPLSMRIFVVGPALMIFPMQARDVVGTFFASPRWFFYACEAGLLILSALILRRSIKFCARKVAQHAESAVETKRQAAFRRKFLTPVLWRKAFRRSLGSKLQRNPLIWLEYRTAWARASRWIIVLLVVGIETILFSSLENREEFIGAHFMMLFALIAFIAFKSSSSFHREKESGAFELLLVAPLTEKQLLSGRLLAVLSYYRLPLLILASVGLFGFTWADSAFADRNRLSAAVNFTSIFASLISVPICGLFFALRHRTFFSGLLWTSFIALLVPICIWSAFNGLLWMAVTRGRPAFALTIDAFLREVWWPVLLAMIVYHALVVLFCIRATINLIRRREFAFNS